ncbi:hypothetical protein LOC67_01145 [Stieleria sp. JC731]|uniref:hypothetical protein n=1 Tax=Pirellulaceae TaxID=2691357 RepID=UPI001E30DD01|nr:hypothetical protein [Stieleria sp. JC731]MCC9599147.1 hypothetical protein [Stieleria sp. JC731]
MRQPAEPPVFLVAESGRRWLDAARRFVGPFAHAAADDPVSDRGSVIRVQAIERQLVRSAIASAGDCFVLWEVDATNCSTIALSIAQVSVSHHDVMQFVAIDRSQRPWSASQLASLMELGVTMLLRRPEDLSLSARLVRRKIAKAATDGTNSLQMHSSPHPAK